MRRPILQNAPGQSQVGGAPVWGTRRLPEVYAPAAIADFSPRVRGEWGRDAGPVRTLVADLKFLLLAQRAPQRNFDLKSTPAKTRTIPVCLARHYLITVALQHRCVFAEMVLIFPG